MCHIGKAKGMCGRFITVTIGELERALRSAGFSHVRIECKETAIEPKPEQGVLPFDDFEEPAKEARDAFPGMRADVVLAEPDGVLVAEKTWGYQAEWTNQLLFNARSEKAMQFGSMWSESLEQRRCIVPSRGFFESDEAKRPHLFALPDDDVLFMAGVYDGDRFSILTCEPNAWVAPIHHRMPVVLRPDALGAWLGADYRPLLDCRDIALDVRA